MEKLKIFFRSRRHVAILIMFIIQVASQAIGAAFYSSFPEWFWTTCDALILVTPLMFGLAAGLICCLPNFVAEILWLIVKGYLGAFLHGVAFMAAVVILGLAGQMTERKLQKHQTGKGLTISLCVAHTVLFELGLILENFLYCLLRAIFIVSKTSPLTLKAIFKSTLSVGNPVCVVLLIAAVVLIQQKQKPVTA